MALSEYFPIWDKLTPDQQERISSISVTSRLRMILAMTGSIPNVLPIAAKSALFAATYHFSCFLNEVIFP